MTRTGLEVTDPRAYQQRMRAQTGGRDPLEVLSETPPRIVALAASAPVEVLRRRPFEGKWTPVEILGHLLDCEIVFGHRIRTVWADERPAIIGIDQDKWVAAQRYNERDPVELAGQFASMRAINLASYRLIPLEAYGRVGVHNERGEETIADMLGYNAGHDLWHIEQFQRYARAAGEMPAG